MLVGCIETIPATITTLTVAIILINPNFDLTEMIAETRKKQQKNK